MILTFKNLKIFRIYQTDSSRRNHIRRSRRSRLPGEVGVCRQRGSAQERNHEKRRASHSQLQVRIS